MTEKIKDVNEIIKDLEDMSEETSAPLNPESYKEKTGKRFRMTKDQKTRGLSREQAFKEFINL